MTLICKAICTPEHSAVVEIEVWEANYEGKVSDNISFAARGMERFAHQF